MGADGVVGIGTMFLGGLGDGGGFVAGFLAVFAGRFNGFFGIREVFFGGGFGGDEGGEVKIFKARLVSLRRTLRVSRSFSRARLVAFNGMNRCSDFGKAGFAFIASSRHFARWVWAVWSCGSVSASALAISASSALRRSRAVLASLSSCFSRTISASVCAWRVRVRRSGV